MEETAVLKFTNIDKEDFTHQYHGQEITVRAGESKMLPEKIARHLAKHLASGMSVRENQKVEDESIERGDKVTKTKIASPEQLSTLTESMLSNADVLEPEKPKETKKGKEKKEKKKDKEEEFEDLTAAPEKAKPKKTKAKSSKKEK